MLLPDTLTSPDFSSLPVRFFASSSYCFFTVSESDHCATMTVTSFADLPVEYVSVYSSSGDADFQVSLAPALVRA